MKYKTVVSINQRIAELRDHLKFLRRNGFLEDEIEAKITELQGKVNAPVKIAR